MSAVNLTGIGNACRPIARSPKGQDACGLQRELAVQMPENGPNDDLQGQESGEGQEGRGNVRGNDGPPSDGSGSPTGRALHPGTPWDPLNAMTNGIYYWKHALAAGLSAAGTASRRICARKGLAPPVARQGTQTTQHSQQHWQEAA